MTDFRNLIQRLTDELDAAASNLYFDDYAPDIKSVLADARAYLAQPEPAPSCVACEGKPSPGNSPCHVCGQSAQPEPQGPTDEELLEVAAKTLGYKHIPSDETCLTAEAGELLEYARAVLARWGRPATAAKPVPVQPEGRQGLTWTSVAEGLRCILQDDSEDAIQLVWQRSRILDAVDLIEANYLPIPVVERLPGPEDCDAEGRCFVWDWLATEWRFLERNVFEYGWEDAYWLPHHALPVPQQEADRD